VANLPGVCPGWSGPKPPYSMPLILTASHQCGSARRQRPARSPFGEEFGSQFFGTPAVQTIASYNQTSRWNAPGRGGTNVRTVPGDALGATSVSFTATLPSTSVWGGVGVAYRVDEKVGEPNFVSGTLALFDRAGASARGCRRWSRPAGVDDALHTWT
jgi:hypothetical protein